ncbi:hypothetical protein RND71_031077 [Anisodus tanguticus]|uniref:Uncharacterized protein n=1 Tax=Anisodus tanguticus TaxID=243964 RepID=A0AAE1UYK5_9SOLA|nr:hypothetical protein RND71_031077 [Anisodus tanguticus]
MATKNKRRPSCARVKVEVNVCKFEYVMRLLERRPKKIMKAMVMLRTMENCGTNDKGNAPLKVLKSGNVVADVSDNGDGKKLE